MKSNSTISSCVALSGQYAYTPKALTHAPCSNPFSCRRGRMLKQGAAVRAFAFMATKESEETKALVQSTFYLECSTGIVRRIADLPNKTKKSGDEAGSIALMMGKPYRIISIKRKTYMSHRIVWLLAYGEWPLSDIDHIDGNGLNNKIDNLRAVSKTENQRNRKLGKNNTSGHAGVSYNKKIGRWLAFIGLSGRTKNLGHYEDFESACKSRKDAEIKYGFHKNNGTVRPS